MDAEQKPHATVHVLKTWPEHFEPLLAGLKTAEMRNNDRNFQLGDYLVLAEYEPSKPGAERFTGDFVAVEVTHILNGPGYGIEKGHCMLSFRKIHSGFYTGFHRDMVHGQNPWWLRGKELTADVGHHGA